MSNLNVILELLLNFSLVLYLVNLLGAVLNFLRSILNILRVVIYYLLSPFSIYLLIQFIFSFELFV